MIKLLCNIFIGVCGIAFGLIKVFFWGAIIMWIICILCGTGTWFPDFLFLPKDALQCIKDAWAGKL